jgi:hypothetical protein
MTVKCRDPQKLTADQVVEAIIIIDDLGDLADKASREIAGPLGALRTRLKTLINEIDGLDHGGGRLIA